MHHTTEALQERVKHHSWGYLSTTEGLRNGILRWNGERHGVDLDPESVVISDGVYPGMIAAMRAFVPRGSKSLLSTPAYSGFYTMARAANVEIVDSQMEYKNGRYEINWDDLESKMTPDVRAMIVCNPQNPTGNVWREEELLRVGRLASTTILWFYRMKYIQMLFVRVISLLRLRASRTRPWLTIALHSMQLVRRLI